ncbi:MAG: L-histidine N(alpha)-methyltransferase [Gaiellaceae bacterium]
MSRASTEQEVRIDVLRDGSERRRVLYGETFRGLQAEVKALPAVWLYDAHGSRLYEEITRLPEYYIPRREGEILRARAGEIAARTHAHTLVELGAGSAKNIRLLLDALDAAGTLERFMPLDVSEETLRASAQAIAAAYSRVSVHAIVGDFERDLGTLAGGDRRLIAFLGSTIGNLYPDQRARFLANLGDALARDDAFLLGIDLVKDAARLEAAYNDSGGVTEAFVRNALTVVNRELDATFDQRRFVYEARWDPEHEWMDIGLRARQAHTVSIDGLELDVALEAGEALRVEISSKFRREQFELEAGQAGLSVESWWTDRARDFAVALMLCDTVAGS